MEAGLHDAFMALGHEVKLFRLTRRMEFWSESLSHWAGMTKQPLPGIDQVVREASDWALIEAAYFRPDLVLIISGMGFHPNAAALLRQHGYRVAVVFTECPYDDDHHEAFAQVCDCVLVNDLSSVERLRAVNPRTWYLPTAYSEGRHYPQDPEGECDAIFVGTGFSERQALIEAVDWAGIEIQLYGFFGWQRELSSPLQAVTREPITNDEAARRYCGAKIGLNFYRSGAGYSLNPRAYELAACGTFQLAEDRAPEAHALFGDSIGYFDGAASLGRQVRYWLRPENDERRRNMAAESWRRVQGQSYTVRAETLIEHVAGVLTM